MALGDITIRRYRSGQLAPGSRLKRYCVETGGLFGLREVEEFRTLRAARRRAVEVKRGPIQYGSAPRRTWDE